MPAHRLPWLKLWPECMAHEKVAMLSDELGWTWIKCLCFAAQQRVRWRFASVEHAASVTGRAAAHIEALIERGLFDQREDGLWVHDYQDWQERYPSDVSPPTDRTLPVAASTKEGTLPEHSVNTPSTLREHVNKTGDVRGETGDVREEGVDGEVQEGDIGITPVLTPVVTPAKAKPRQKRLPEEVHPALRVVKEVLKQWPVPGVREAIVAAVGLESTDIDRWREVCMAVGLHGVNPRNMACALDWYRDGIPDRRSGKHNAGNDRGAHHDQQRPSPDNSGSANWPTLDQQASLY